MNAPATTQIEEAVATHSGRYLGREAGATNSDDRVECSKRLREKYQRLADAMPWGAHLSPSPGSGNATRFSPGNRIPWLTDLGVSSWNSEMQSFGEVEGSNSVSFQKCK